ncbi:MAG: exonuclease subunit SbcD [Marinomonas sp.]
MKILHTSDWHLGQFFMGKSRKNEHSALINWLFECVEEQNIDVVLIAGDIFDTGSPPSYARELYNQLVLGLHKRACQLVIVAGNHDSVSMLNESKTLLAELTTYVVAAADPQQPDEHVIKLYKKGSSDVAALMCAVPYIRPRDIFQSEAGLDERRKQGLLAEQIKDFYQDVYQAAQAQSQMLGGVPILGSGHLTTLGASISESVREIYVGTLESFPMDYFPPFSYLALGHIHRPQKVSGLDHVRYSGSPIALSFDELARNKSMVLVDYSQSHTEPAIQTLEIPSFQALFSTSGELSQVVSELKQAHANLDQSQGETPTLWAEVTLVSDEYVSDLYRQLQMALEDLDIELLRVKRQLKTQVQSMPQGSKETLAELSVTEVFELCVDSAGIDEDKAQLTHLFKQQYQAMLASQEALEDENL